MNHNLLFLVAGGLGLAWMARTGSDAPAASFLPVHAAPAAYLQGAQGPVASALTGGSNRSHLASSAIPSTPPFFTCSVDTSDPGAPPTCSTPAGTARCSAMCDSGQSCSAFFQGGMAAARCSTQGVGSCSALQPRPAGLASNALCSAFGGGPADVQCSVLQPGSVQECSAQNPAVATNICSVISGSIGPSTQCSVLALGSVQRSYCSVGYPPGANPKQCSTIGGAGSQCSVLMGARGACTAFRGAAAPTCSALGGPGHCSVIHGASGTLCVQ